MRYVDMIDAVLARCKGCPTAEAVDAMRNTCMEFCTDTYWLTTGNQIVVDGTQVELTDLETQVVDVIEARIADETILVTYLNDPAIADLAIGEYALQFTDPNNGVLTPAATVDAPVTIDLLLAIAPGPSSTEVTDLLWQRWSEALKSGALARLMAEPGTAWWNPDTATYHRALFADAKAKASAQAGRNRMNVARRLRVQPV